MEKGRRESPLFLSITCEKLTAINDSDTLTLNLLNHDQTVFNFDWHRITAFYFRG